MDIRQQIEAYITSLPEPKQAGVRELHLQITDMFPGCKLWFLDGKDANGKTVSNPNIGYGAQTMHYANGSTREFYKIGLSANTTGISVYILTLVDKKYLAETYGAALGKASVTGYCIKFKALKDINIDVLKAAILDGFGRE